MSYKKKVKNPNFVDDLISYELSKKEIGDRLNWLNKLDQESWFTINHLINDYKNLEKN